MNWNVTYRTKDGKQIVDSFEAENREELFKSLAGKGITPIRVEMSKGRRGAATASADRKRTSSGTHTSYKLVVYALCLILAGALFLILYPKAKMPQGGVREQPKSVKSGKPENPKANRKSAKPVVADKPIEPNYKDMSNKDLRHLSADKTNNLTEAQIEYWKMFHPWPPPDENQPKREKPRYAIFDTRADNEIAFVLSTVPGQMVIGQRGVGAGFEERFLKSITRPIVINEKDSDYDKALKRSVIEAKIQLKQAYDNGENIAKILDDARAELQRLGRFRHDLEKEAMKQLRGKNKTAQDIEDMITAVNAMLDEKGLAPIELNSMSRLALKLQAAKQDANENKEN